MAPLASGMAWFGRREEVVVGRPEARCPHIWLGPCCSKFRLSYYPHCLASFTELVQAAFGGRCQHSVLGDFKPYLPGQAYIPCYFIHVLKKTD